MLLRFNYWSVIMYYCLLPQKGWNWLSFPDQSEALGGAIAAIASSVGRSEALSESHRSLPQGNPATVSDILDNPEKGFSWLSRFSGHGRWKWTSDLNFARLNTQTWIKKGKISILDILNLFSATVIAWHSELYSLNVWDGENFPNWWDAIQRFSDLWNLNPDIHIRQPAEILGYSIIEGFRIRP